MTVHDHTTQVQATSVISQLTNCLAFQLNINQDYYMLICMKIGAVDFKPDESRYSIFTNLLQNAAGTLVFWEISWMCFGMIRAWPRTVYIPVTVSKV